MQAGRLDRKIDIQRKTEAASGSGFPVETWSTIVARRSASMRSLKGDERFAAPETVATEQIEFRIRYSAIVADLTPLDRIIHPALSDDQDQDPVFARIHDILAIAEIGRREGLQIITIRRPDVLVLEASPPMLDFSRSANSQYLPAMGWPKMPQVDELTVKDSDGTERLVPSLAPLIAKDFATQATLAALLAKVIAAPSTEAKQDALAALVGEVQASPTSNTLLDRLKQIFTALGSPMQSSGGSVGLVPVGFSASASFTPAAAAYGAGDLIDVAKEFVFTDVNGDPLPSGALIRILTSIVKIDQTGVISGETSYSLPLYGVTPPSAQSDNAAWTLASGDLTAYKGTMSLGTPVDLGAACYIKTSYQDFDIKLTGTSVFGQLVTAGAFTATAVARQVSLYGIVL